MESSVQKDGQQGGPQFNAAVIPPVSRAEGDIGHGKPSSSVLETDPGAAFTMEDGDDLGITKTISLFKSLDYGFLLPFKKILSFQLLRKRAVRWVLFFGLAPIAFFVIAGKLGVTFPETIWLFQLYFCFFWAIYFHSLINPGPGIWKRAAAYGAFTILVGMPIDMTMQSFPILRNLFSGTESDSVLVKIVAFVFGVGILEETVKALPLILFGLRKQKLGPRDGLFLGFVSGLGFAASEGVVYSLSAATSAFGADSDFADKAFTIQILQTIFRFMSGTLLHGAWAGIAGWFIGLATQNKTHQWPLVCIGIGFVALLHGINDVVAGSSLHLVLAGGSILIFMAYLVHDETVANRT